MESLKGVDDFLCNWFISVDDFKHVWRFVFDNKLYQKMVHISPTAAERRRVTQIMELNLLV